MSISGIESNGIGGGFGGGVSPWGIGNFGGGGGGLGAVGLFGLIGLDGLRGRDGHGHDDCAKSLFLMKSIYDAKDSIDERIDSTRDSLANGLMRVNDTTVAEGRGLAAAICGSEMHNMQQFYAAAIQASNNTQAIKDQATAFAIVNDKRFDDLALAGVTQTAAVLARINQTEVDNLRDQLALERTRCGHLESKETITQMGIAFGNQIQAANSNVVAVQTQVGQLTNVLAGLANQVNKTSQDIINVGGILTGAANTANPVNVK